MPEPLSLTRGVLYQDFHHNLAATAPVRNLSNGGVERGPSRLPVSSIPQDALEALSKVQVEDLFNYFLTTVKSVLIPPAFVDTYV